MPSLLIFKDLIMRAIIKLLISDYTISDSTELLTAYSGRIGAPICRHWEVFASWLRSPGARHCEARSNLTLNNKTIKKYSLLTDYFFVNLFMWDCFMPRNDGYTEIVALKQVPVNDGYPRAPNPSNPI